MGVLCAAAVAVVDADGCVAVGVAHQLHLPNQNLLCYSHLFDGTVVVDSTAVAVVVGFVVAGVGDNRRRTPKWKRADKAYLMKL